MAAGTDEALAGAAADLLKLVGNPNRLRILYLLTEGECSVSEIEQRLGIRQPTLSQQLGELRNAEVVATRREHKVVFYSLSDPRMGALLGAIEDILILKRPQQRAAVRIAEARAHARDHDRDHDRDRAQNRARVRARDRALGQAAQFGSVGDEP